MEHRTSFRVYYEDTDCLGVVYHANYLKYLERGRTEYIEALGRSIGEWNGEGVYFLVYSMNIKFRKAALLGDRLEVVSRFRLESDYRGIFHQRIEKEGDLVVKADVEVVCTERNREIREFPAELKKLSEG